MAVEFSSPLFTDKLLMYNCKNKRKYVGRDEIAAQMPLSMDGRVHGRESDGGERKVIVMAQNLF